MQLEYIDFILDSLVSTDFYIEYARLFCYAKRFRMSHNAFFFFYDLSVNLDDLRKLMKETNSRIKRKIMKFGPHLEKQCGDVSRLDDVYYKSE